MKSITFPEATNKIAENQEEYKTVISQWNPDEQSVNMCFELDDADIAEINRTRKVWYKQLTFGRKMNPMRISPFKNMMIFKRKEVNALDDIDTTTIEGKLLFASLALITTESRTEETPNEVLHAINELKEKIDFKS